MIKFARVVKVALQYIQRNFGLSFASVVVTTLSFFIVSIVGLSFYASSLLVQYVDSKPALVIFLRGDLDEQKANRFREIVNSTGLAKDISIRDVQYSKEDFAKKFPDPELQQVLQSDEVKTFIPIVTFVYSDSQENLQKLISILENNQEFIDELVDKKNIDRVGWYSFNHNQAEIIQDANRLISAAGIVISVGLFLISSVLIFITIKLTINYHKREIEIMDLVGADGWFIRLPFVIDGVIYGVLGAIFSTSIILGFKNMIFNSSQSLIPRLTRFFGEVPWPSFDAQLILELYLITILAGAVVGALSSFFAIIKYVDKK